jgi:hypothetical protein
MLIDRLVRGKERRSGGRECAGLDCESHRFHLPVDEAQVMDGGQSIR